jgi:3-oxoacyl-[acyl-carrier protein] reductase
MNPGLEGRVALVGGASRGLGFACARALAREGAAVALAAREEGALSDAAETIAAETGAEAIAVEADLSVGDDIERLVRTVLDRFGRIDVLVHNTGGPPPGLFLDHDDAAWQAAFEGLLLSFVRCCRAVVPVMRERGWGRIIANTSFTVREPAERLALSNALRTAVVSASKTLAREVAGDGITVNCVAPGAFETQRLRSIFAAQATSTERTVEAVRAEWETQIPLGRVSRPEELGALVAFLASEQAASITGACLPVDGGMLHGLF